MKGCIYVIIGRVYFGDMKRVPQFRDLMLFHSLNASINPLLDKHHLEAAAVTPPSESCRDCRCLCHMEQFV